MTKKIIAVDIDEVLFPFLDEFLKHHNKLYGSELKSHEFEAYDFGAKLNISAAEETKRIYDFTVQLSNSQVEPIKLAQDSIAKLSTKYDLEIVTARHSKFEDVTIHWLETHFPKFFKNVSMIGYAPIMDKPLTKAEVCLASGAIALIDDSLLHITEAAAAGIEGILFGNYSWNQMDKLPENVTRCISWPEVLAHFKV